MALYARPECLIKLAVDALGKYVSDLLVQLVIFPEYTATEGQKQRYVGQTCRRLQEELVWTLPSSLVNEVVTKLLYCLNKSYSDVYYSVYRQWGDVILPSVLNAILHPALTRLETVEDILHAVECHDFMWDCLFLNILDNIHRLANLKILRFGYIRRTKDWILFDVNVSENLEHFSFLELCNDRLLKNLAEKCKRLKSIDVSFSKNVTDHSVECLLKFEYLEELNINYTSITGYALTRLLIGLSQTKVHHSEDAHKHSLTMLKSFGCGNIASSNMKLLIETFQNLTSVNLSCEEGSSLSPLKKLKHLTKVTLCDTEFPYAEDLLFAIGPQLVFLELYHVYDINFRFIGENCPSVRCLHVTSRSSLDSDANFAILMESYYESSVSVFNSVQCLRLEFDNSHKFVEYIVSECKQLKKLYVGTGSHFARLLLQVVIQRNQLIHLEEYHWGKGFRIGGNVIMSRPNEGSVCVSVVDSYQRNRILLRTEELKV
jgi:hypothetical protein